MELYVAVGLAVVTLLLIRRKRDGGVDMEVSSPVIKPFNHLPMDIDEAVQTLTPLRLQQPPSPMSTSSEEAFRIDSNYGSLVR